MRYGKLGREGQRSETERGGQLGGRGFREGRRRLQSSPVESGVVRSAVGQV